MEKELLERLRCVLNLPTASTAADISAELAKVQGIIAQMQQEGGQTVGLAALLEQSQARIAALSAKTPDPAKFVPVETVTALQAKIADLSGRIDAKEVDDLVEVGLSDGRILPEMADWARELGKTNRAALSAYLEKATPIAALTKTQTGGKLPAGGTPADGKPVEKRAKDEWAASAALQAEFGGDQDAYIAYCKAEQNGQVKVFKGGKA